MGEIIMNSMNTERIIKHSHFWNIMVGIFAFMALTSTFMASLSILGGCAGMSVQDTVESIAEKAGFAAYAYLPEYRHVTLTTCTVKDVIQTGDDPLVIQGLIEEQIGQIWVASTKTDKVFVALLLNDMVRVMGLKSEKAPTMEHVAKWLGFLDAFCGGVDLASKVK